MRWSDSILFGPWASFLGLAVLVAAILAGCTAIRPERRESPPAQQTPSNPITRGAELYNANCLGCHGGAIGGDMMDIPPPHNANGHTWHHPDCQLIDVVLNGSGGMGEMMRRMMGVPENAPRMPAFRGKLTEEDVEAILAYIKTWWTEEQRVWQTQITQARC